MLLCVGIYISNALHVWRMWRCVLGIAARQVVVPLYRGNLPLGCIACLACVALSPSNCCKTLFSAAFDSSRFPPPPLYRDWRCPVAAKVTFGLALPSGS